MTTTLHVANSARVAGVGLFSGGAYGSLKQFSDLYVKDEKIVKDIDDFDAYYTKNEQIADATSFITFANDAASKGKIDPLSNLNNKPVFIASNKKDWVVPAFLQYEQKKFYDSYSANVMF